MMYAISQRSREGVKHIFRDGSTTPVPRNVRDLYMEAAMAMEIILKQKRSVKENVKTDDMAKNNSGGKLRITDF